MVAQQAQGGVRAPLAGVVMTMCGVVGCSLVGCTSGPEVASSQQEANVATVSADTGSAGDEETGVETRLATLGDSWSSVFQAPRWWDRMFGVEKAPSSPFLLTSNEQGEADSMIDFTPVYIEPVEFDTPTPERATVVTPLGGQLAAAPLDESQASPFRPDQFSSQRVHFSPQSDRPTRESEPSDRTRVFLPLQTPRSSFSTPRGEPSNESAVPVTDFLSTGINESAGLLHEGMIVSSSLVPSQFDHRIQTVSAEEDLRGPSRRARPPRRHFGEPTWCAANVTPSVSANVPVSVAPRVPHAAQSPALATPVQPDGVPFFSGSEWYGNPPTAAAFNGDFECDFDRGEGAVSQGMKSVNVTGPSRNVALAVVAPKPRHGAPKVAQARDTTDERPLANAIDLSVAKTSLTTDTDNAPRIPREVGKPAVVGIGLVAIVVGAAMIRSRLA